MKKVIIAPSTYIQGNGEIKNLAEHYLKLGSKKAYIIADAFIKDKYENEIISSFVEKSTAYELVACGGECCDDEINKHIDALGEADVVIGIGGGKTIDTSKAVAYFKNVPVIIVPTAASTDAPCSRLSVIYTNEGTVDRYLFLKSNPDLVLMDLDVIADAPARFLVSGMGDAMATYYEAMASNRTGSLVMAGGYASKTALAIAKLCRDTLLEDGVKAKLAAENHVCSESFENIVEANTYLSGIGFESGGVAASHSIHNGLCTLEACHHFYHGEKVAFGVVCQLMMENNPDLDLIIKFFKSVGLPVCLKDFGIENITDEELMQVAETAVAPGETIHAMYMPLSPKYIFDVIKAADAYASKF